jgi:murein DD-endopeptidase MepM/ murein hydrolase activator NlpD
VAGGVCAATLALALVPGVSKGAGKRPAPADLRCLSECAGLRAAAAGGAVAVTGRRLGGVSEVRFAGTAGPITVAPSRADPTKLVVQVPAGAETGHLRLAKPSGQEAATRQRLAGVDGSQVPNGFSLRSATVRPRKAFFDQARPITVSYRFEAPERTGVRVEVIRASGDRTVKTFRRKDVLPYSKHTQPWSGLERDGDVADDGRYQLRVGAFGEGSSSAGSVRLRGHKFPVRGGHGYGGYLQSFGAPRSGGRRHLGQDVYANCGTRLEAARGGRVQKRDHDPELLGHYIVIDTKGSKTDHLYVHMPSPSPFREGQRVHTGQRVGAVGKTGNARTTPCHLHFEIWPNGWHNGSPVDPKPHLKRWDNYS